MVKYLTPFDKAIAQGYNYLFNDEEEDKIVEPSKTVEQTTTTSQTIKMPQKASGSLFSRRMSRPANDKAPAPAPSPAPPPANDASSTDIQKTVTDAINMQLHDDAVPSQEIVIPCDISNAHAVSNVLAKGPTKSNDSDDPDFSCSLDIVTSTCPSVIARVNEHETNTTHAPSLVLFYLIHH